LKRLAAAFLLIVSAGAAALLAEWGVRILRPGFVAGPDAAGNPFWTHDPDLGWFHTPGLRGTFSRSEFSHRVSINAMGFRDRERPTSPRTGGGEGRSGEGAAGPYRIAVLGDSFAWGHGVEDEQVFTRLLEAALPGVEVWNVAVSAYSTDQELLLLRRFGGQVRPHLVLVMVSRNDFGGNLSDAYSGYPKPRFVERDGDLALVNVPVPAPPWWMRAVSWTRRRSAFVNGLWYLFEGRGDGSSGVRPNREDEIRMTLRILDEIDAEARRIGARLAVGLVPSVAHVYFGDVPPLEAGRFAALEEWGRDRAVPVLDLAPAFRETFAATGEWLHYRKDKHWNAAGHRAAAQVLAPFLTRLRGGS